METKSSLKALQPVELRLAASFRLRREIARLTEIDDVLRAEARDMTATVIGDRPEVVEVMLDVIGKPFEQDPDASADAFGAGAVEAFLAGEHDLRLEGAPAPEPDRPGADLASPAPGAAGAPASAPVLPAAGPAAVQPHGAAQPQEAGVSPQDAERQSPAEAVMDRLAGYDAAMPEDFFGVTFDMLKRPEAELIMAEAALAVVDGLPLDASPYKADRGKVHWRRKLFEEAFAHFQANPPRSADGSAGERAASPAPAAPVPAAIEPAPATSLPTAEPAAAAAHLPEADEVAEEDVPGFAAPAEQPDVAETDETVEGDSEAEAEADAGLDAVPDAEILSGEDDREPSGAIGQATAEAAEETTGRVIDFPVQAARGHGSEAEDVLDPFGAGPSLAPARAPAQTLFSGGFEDRAEDPLGETPPPYEGDDWDEPVDDAERLDREFRERTGFDRLDGTGSEGAGLDAAAAAALADVVETPAPAPVQGLPTGGVPPRPAMPNLRPAPAMPPRPAGPPPAMPSPAAVSPSPVAVSPVASAAPPARPSLAPGAEVGGRIPPRPVAIRPPGL